MNYEKKYNEALNWMRELYPGVHEHNKKMLEQIFPELRESEDERIRKGLIEALKASKTVGELKFVIPEPTREECIAYLEKQEQKPISQEDFDTAKHEALWKEQKPELVQHPPITYTYPSDASRDERLKAALLALLNSDLIKVKEGGYFTKQDLIEWVERIPTDKPAWSEDERMLKKIIEYLEMIKMGCVICTIDTSEEIAWLERKKIPSVSFNPALGFDPGSAVVYHNDDSEDERMRKLIIDRVRSATEMTEGLRELLLSYLEKQEQKPAECIEDSVKFEEGFKVGRESGLRDGQKYVLNNLDSYGLCKPAWSEELDIDTLREWSMRYAPDIRQAIESTAYHFYNLRPHWKPSEEQMEALDRCVDYLDESDNEDAGIIESLYEQLKKL